MGASILWQSLPPPPGASPHCSQRGKTPLYCLQSSRFPLILIGLGLHTFQSRNEEAGALNSLGALTHGSWKVPVKTVASAIFLHLLPCCPPHSTARDRVNTSRLTSIAKSLPTNQLLSSEQTSADRPECWLLQQRPTSLLYLLKTLGRPPTSTYRSVSHNNPSS